MKRSKQLTKRERKAIYGKGPSIAPSVLRERQEHDHAFHVERARDPSVPEGARGEVIEGDEAREWVLSMLELAARVMVRRDGDQRSEPTLVCWLSPEETRRFDAVMPAPNTWRDDTLFDVVTSALDSALPGEDVEGRVRGHVVGVISMESPMPRWQRLSASLEGPIPGP